MTTAQQWIDQGRAGRIEDALHEIVSNAIQYDGRPRIANGAGSAMTLEEISGISLDDHDLDDWLNDPIATSYRNGIKSLGWHLYRLTKSLEAMEVAAERVAQRDAASYGVRINIIDHAWDGIGEGEDRWWA